MYYSHHTLSQHFPHLYADTIYVWRPVLIIEVSIRRKLWKAAIRSTQAGSEKMVGKRLQRRTFTEAQWKQVVTIFDDEQIKLLDYLINGQPDPEVLHGVATVKIQEAASLIDKLFGSREMRVSFDGISPLGTPFPDVLLLNFKVTPPIPG